MSASSRIRSLISLYLNDLIDLSLFADQFSDIFENVEESGDKSAVELSYRVESLLAKASDGFVNSDDFVSGLRDCLLGYSASTKVLSPAKAEPESSGLGPTWSNTENCSPSRPVPSASWGRECYAIYLKLRQKRLTPLELEAPGVGTERAELDILKLHRHDHGPGLRRLDRSRSARRHSTGSKMRKSASKFEIHRPISFEHIEKGQHQHGERDGGPRPPVVTPMRENLPNISVLACSQTTVYKCFNAI